MPSGAFAAALWLCTFAQVDNAPKYLLQQARRLDCACVGGTGVGDVCQKWGKDARPWCFVGGDCDSAQQLGRKHWRHCDGADGQRGIGRVKIPAGFATLADYAAGVGARIRAFQAQIRRLPPGDLVRERIVHVDLPPLHELYRGLADTPAPTPPPTASPIPLPTPPPTPVPTPPPGPTPDPVCAMCHMMKQPCKSIENGEVTCDYLVRGSTVESGGECAPGQHRC